MSLFLKVIGEISKINQNDNKYMLLIIITHLRPSAFGLYRMIEFIKN